MGNSNPLASTVTEAKENRKVIEATKAINCDQISKLDNSQIALRLYFLIANGAEKSTDDFCEIGKHLHSFAIQLSR